MAPSQVELLGSSPAEAAVCLEKTRRRTGSVLIFSYLQRKVSFFPQVWNKVLTFGQIQQVLHHHLQSHQVDKLIVSSWREEVDLWCRGFWRRDLQQGFFQLLSQGQLGSSLSAGRGVVDIDRGGVGANAWLGGHWRTLQPSRRALKIEQETKRKCYFYSKTPILCHL